MARWRIDTERASARVTFRPGIPGLGITVRGLSGEFDLTLGDDGRPDMRIPVRGEFALALADLDAGPLTKVSRSLLSGGDQIPIHGTIRDVARTKGHDHDEFGFVVDVTMRGETHSTDGIGTSGVLDGDRLGVEGRTTVNPRAVGVPVPRIFHARGNIVWDLALVLLDS
jgi:hypothetical protein